MASVFVSHRVVDAELAEKLAAQIRSAGHTVWLDEWEIGLGDSIVQRMAEGLEASRFLVLCYSEAGVDSPWMGREWMSALARQLQSEEVRILPVRLSGGTAPAILADVKYADLTADWDSGVQELCAALGPR
ncbi:toll/interleukin-1 receptor domain-containing protein [Streptomyces sp. NPDC058676]|uniref:toll/interleukin-1 receptor domain-containing protein n=1 Tax=unclassified Streptomyces TaxID=2593676 RepID=UPI003664D1D8